MEAGLVLLFVLQVLRVQLLLSWFATVAHAIEELGGDLPAYFTRIGAESVARRPAFVVRVPRWFAVALFGPALASTLLVLALYAYPTSPAWAQSPQGTIASVAAAALCGARLGDSVLSHWLLSWFERPNPGLRTTLLYAGEGVMLAVQIHWGIEEAAAFAIAAGSFLAINPVIGPFVLLVDDERKRRT